MTGLSVSEPASVSGLLADFCSAGVLLASDVHVARTLARLTGESSESVLLAAALAVRGVRHGSVCIDLSTISATAVPEVASGDHTVPGATVDVADLPWPEPDVWARTLAESPMVATTPPPGAWLRAPRHDARPLHLRGHLLYLDRYAQLEDQVRAVLHARSTRAPAAIDPTLLHTVVDEVMGEAGFDQQRQAVAAAATGWFTVVAGGPGTGKTTTVARIVQAVRLLAERTGDPPPRIALAAPTGRAAARLAESVRALLGETTPTESAPSGAATLHRLLGTLPRSRSRFRHDIDNRLPYDLVVVDETSMVSLEMMARLMEALPREARLVLVGDPDQLASVDAGAVLADLVAREPQPDVVRLTRNYRFGGVLTRLAESIRNGDADGAVDLLSGSNSEDGLEWVDVDVGSQDADAPRVGTADLGAVLAGLRDDVAGPGRDLVTAARLGDGRAALDALGRHRLLCAHRSGPYGVGRWRVVAHHWVRAAVDDLPDLTPGAEADEDFYVGRPLLATANDPRTGVFNGDTGVVIAEGEGMLAVFDAGGGTLRTVAISRLGAMQTPLAMTVHKAQGSEADRVTVILPSAHSRLLTRELFYTAVTRARHHVRIVGSADAVRAAVGRSVVRASGLRSS